QGGRAAAGGALRLQRRVAAVRRQARRLHRGDGSARAVVTTRDTEVNAMKSVCTLIIAAAFSSPALAADVAAPPPPAVTISLGNRQAQGTPTRQGFSHTGGGNIDVQQPSADVLVVTMTGVAVAGGHPCKDSFAALAFDLAQ